MTTFPAKGVRSLCWQGDDLVDWVGGGATFHLDGSAESARVRYPFAFDAAATSPDGKWVVIYQRLGTKAAILREGRVVRELNRSFYHANAYEYPICFVREPGGRLLLAHCPEQYCRLELADVETAACLTASASRQPADFFHSRLAADPSGTRFLSAGWMWHPWDAVVHFDIADVLRDPTHLDHLRGAPDGLNVCLAEESSACWLDDERVAIAASNEPEDPEEVAALGERLHLRPRGVAVYHVAEQRIESSVVLERVAGTLMAAGPGRVVAFFEWPRLIEVTSGEVIEEWPSLPTGRQVSSIIWGLKERLPPLALDPGHRRFAVASEDQIAVVSLA